MPWQETEARVAQTFSCKGRAGVAIPDLDLFGEQVQRVTVPSNAGRPRVPLRIMIALLYLKHAFNESDEGVEGLSAQTINASIELKLIKPQHLQPLYEYFFSRSCSSSLVKCFHVWF